MVMTVSSLGPARSCKPKVRAGPKEVLSITPTPTPYQPCREGIGNQDGPGWAEEVLTGSRIR